MPQIIALTLTDDEVAAVTVRASAILPIPLTVEQWMNQFGKSDLAMMVEAYHKAQAATLYQQVQALDPATKASILTSISTAVSVATPLKVGGG